MGEDVTSIALASLGGVFALVLAGAWCYCCISCIKVRTAYRKEKKQFKRNSSNERQSRLTRQTTIPTAPLFEDVIEMQSSEQKKKTDRPYFIKTALCHVAASPFSPRSIINSNFPTPSSHSDQNTEQLNATDADSFSHMDFALFDLLEDEEDGSGAAVSRPPPLYSDLFSYTAALNMTLPVR